MSKYNHSKIEKKWQAYWQSHKSFLAKDFSKKPKKYILTEFPYPSGQGLHMGHLRPYVAGDVTARFNRLKGFETIFPMGWDAFGLPAENYAIKTGVNPAISTAKNVKNAKRQLRSWGMSFDWSREVNTTDPNYYKWTQWLFLQFYKAGLAYEATGLINWCPKDKTGLANEEVIDGRCERCGTLVEKKELRQWYLKITAYAEKLLEGLKNLPAWPEAVKQQQQNWIGKSEGLEEYWQVDGMDIKLATFTTWPHTTWGATFMVIAPEHPIIEKLVKGTKYEQGANEFIKKCIEEKIKDPLNIEKEKSGYFLGKYVINHFGGWKMPLYIANFAIMDYGTGIVKCTPTHDQRDFEFAKKYGLPFKLVIQPKDKQIKVEEMAEAYTGEGVMLNASQFTGMDTLKARKAIADFSVVQGAGKYVTNYKLRDWVFSRQRYWGEPIPLVHCAKCALKDSNIKRFVILHGKGETTKDAFIPWLKKELENRGFEVQAANLPHSKNPSDEEQAEFAIKKLKFDDSTVVVGHSFGGVVALRLLERGIKINALILAGTPFSGEFLDGKQRATVTAALKKGFDFKTIKNNCKKFVCLYDISDYAVPVSDGESFASALGVDVVKTGTVKSHFTAKKEPEVLNQSLSFISLKRDVGWIPVPDKDLPVKLPPVKKYEPTGTGESPLASITKWVNVKCPVCKGPAKRETNTMPQWAGSSWYWLRYTDPKNKKEFAALKNQKHWTPVDIYFGGMEHTTLHLLYSRFWNLFLYDQGLVTVKEPYVLRKPHGIILGSDGEKMSKSRGNVVNPDDIVKSDGADTLRMYELFLGPHEAMVSWNDKGVAGVKRFLEKVYKIGVEISQAKNSGRPEFTSGETYKLLHKTIKKVTEDIENFRFNTCVPAFMILVNQIYSTREEMAGSGDSGHKRMAERPGIMSYHRNISKENFKKFLVLLYPFAPHISEELNQLLGGKKSLQLEQWPEWDAKFVIDETVDIVIQINGKVKGKINVPTFTDEQEITRQALNLSAIKSVLSGQQPKRTIYVKHRLINFVI